MVTHTIHRVFTHRGLTTGIDPTRPSTRPSTQGCAWGLALEGAIGLGPEMLRVRGARQHNLQSIDVDVPRNAFCVFTGISGSGKSSLAFDTIYAEGQRRYVESLSAYARQFLGQMDKPDVDEITGLSPAISIDQKTTSHNPRSTVGTVTEIYDYLRLLYARVGQPHCPQCGRPITRWTIEQMADHVLELPRGTRILVLGPTIRGRKGEHVHVFEDLRKAGFVRGRVDGQVVALDPVPSLDKKKRHDIDVVVDRLVIDPEARSRLAEALETACRHADGSAIVHVLAGEGVPERDVLFSERFGCPICGTSMEELEPRLFSFNNPRGACPSCTGLGSRLEVDPDLILPDLSLSLRQGAVAPWGWRGNYLSHMLEAVVQYFGTSIDTPLRDWDPALIQVLLDGAPEERIPFEYEGRFGRRRDRPLRWEGLVPLYGRYFRDAGESVRQSIETVMRAVPCAECRGRRLKPEALAVTLGGSNIAEFTALPVRQARTFIDGLTLDERGQRIARQILKEITERLGFLCSVGLDYLTLDRQAGSLSGGEAQRIRLATQIGSGLVGVLYILDEPSIGLHARDNRRLIDTLYRLRDLGNTLIVVEHDEETIRSADYVVDIGPGAGTQGGRVVVCGTPDEVMACQTSITGDFLSGRQRIPIPERRRTPGERWIVVTEARQHNLRGIDVRFPLGLFTAVTGVSGSGKSTLVNEILYRHLAMVLNGARQRPGRCAGVLGVEQLRKVIDVDQSPIGRTPRSNPATYTGLFTDVRDLFARTQEARARGYLPGRFSFNVKGGRCEACQGDGIIQIEMHFLPDVYVPCEVCHGSRYNRETLQVLYRGKSIADVLEMTVEEAAHFYATIPSLRRKLETLVDVGLGYIRLGQPATTLSGGEAQRVKLATELGKRSDGGTVYILDEPTTGLHSADIAKLLQVLHRLVDNGDTVIVIEHNLDVIKTADWVIDLGPEGGDAGGALVACGTPEEVSRVDASYTGKFLRAVLDSSGRLDTSPALVGRSEEWG